MINNLKQKAKVVSDFLNSLEGITCPEVRKSNTSVTFSHVLKKRLIEKEKVIEKQREKRQADK